MSDENKQKTDGMYAAFAKGDVPYIIGALDPQVAGKHRQTGREVRAQFGHVFKLRDGRVVKFQQYTDTFQFLQAVAG